MSGATYVTVQNDRLDRICRLAYGTERNGTVETVMNANRGLEQHGALLPAGLTIILPAIAKEPAPIIKAVHLWT